MNYSLCHFQGTTP